MDSPGLDNLVLLLMDSPVVDLITLIKESPPVVIGTLILVVTAVRPAVFNITIPSDILPTMPSYLIRKPLVQNDNPRAMIARRTIPMVTVIEVIVITVVDNIIRAAYGYGKTLGSQVYEVRRRIDYKRGMTPRTDLNA
jgi:hypothetical protein